MNKFKLLLLSMMLIQNTYATTSEQPINIVNNKNYINYQKFDNEKVPEELKKWVPWVKKNNLNQNCIDNYCIFVSNLEINKKNNSYLLNIQGDSLESVLLELPYDYKHWPYNVNINNKNAIVINQNNKPYIEIPKGIYEINVAYKNIFENSEFSLPFDVVKFNNKTSENISYKDNKLTLNKTNNIQEKNDYENIQVYRNFKDNIPYELETEIKISYSGKNKELNIGKIIPDNFENIQANSDLKITYNNNDKNYSIYVTSGNHYINFKSISKDKLSVINVDKLVNQTKFEIWTINNNNNIRNIEIKDVKAINENSVEIPDRWKGLPTYYVNKEIKFNEIQQGIDVKNKNNIQVTRETYLTYHNKIYNQDNIQILNKLDNEYVFNRDIKLDYFKCNNDKYKMIYQDKYPYVLLNPQERMCSVSFQSTKEIPTKLNNDYNITNWNISLPLRNELLWVENAEIKSNNYWLNAWNLYSLFSLSILIISLYRLIGKEVATIALISFISFYNNNSIFWIFWILLIISYAANQYIPEKYNKIKNQLNGFNIIGTVLVLLYSINFMYIEIYSIIHPNVYKVSIINSINEIIKFIIGLILIIIMCKAVLKLFKYSFNVKYSFKLLFILTATYISLNLIDVNNINNNFYNYNIRQNLTTEGAMIGAIPASPTSISPMLKKVEMLDSIERVSGSSANESISLERNIEENVQVGNNYNGDFLPHKKYTIENKNGKDVKLIIANKCIVNTYTILQIIFLLILSYVFIIYNILLSKNSKYINYIENIQCKYHQFLLLNIKKYFKE